VPVAPTAGAHLALAECLRGIDRMSGTLTMAGDDRALATGPDHPHHRARVNLEMPWNTTGQVSLRAVEPWRKTGALAHKPPVRPATAVGRKKHTVAHDHDRSMARAQLRLRRAVRYSVETTRSLQPKA